MCTVRKCFFLDDESSPCSEQYMKNIAVSPKIEIFIPFSNEFVKSMNTHAVIDNFSLRIGMPQNLMPSFWLRLRRYFCENL